MPRHIFDLLPILLSITLATPAYPLAAGKSRSESAPTPWPKSTRSIDRPRERRELVVLTYNLNGLPLPDKDHTRYRKSGRLLAERRAEGTAPHVVLVQEAFHRLTRDFVRESGYPFVAQGPRKKGARTGGGLYILSEFPILASSHRVYTQCHGWDCLSRKGVLHARIEVPGLPQPIELYTTHLNAGPAKAPWLDVEETREVRLLQTQEIREFLWETQASHLPMIFGGDFNFRPDEDAYLFFKTFSLMTDTAHHCLTTASCGDSYDLGHIYRRKVDRIFYLPGTSPSIGIRPVEYHLRFTEPVDGKKLSDHDGVEVRYELTW